MIFLNKLEEIPINARVCLYGAGDGGSNFMRLLELSRRDIEITCFMDDFKTGSRDGVGIINSRDLKIIQNGCELILVTSTYWKEMIGKLMENGVDNYRVVDPALLFSYQVFTNEEIKIFENDLANVKSMLADEKDKELYSILVENRKKGHVNARNPYEFYLRTLDRTPDEYLDFINTKSIRVIIEGGVLDGKNTLHFLDILQTGGLIHGFEPYYDGYLESEYKTYFDTLLYLRVFPFALWENTTKLEFAINTENREGSRIASDIDASGPRMDVDAVSIDEHVRDYEIAKVDFIKLDIEGAELQALKGARETLRKHRPQLAVCIYHKKNDIFEVPLYLGSILTNYQYRIGHYSTTFWGTVLYAIPTELCDQKS